MKRYRDMVDFTKKYTEEDLKKNSDEYDANFEMVLATHGTKKHAFYSDRERMLAYKGEVIRKILGLIPGRVNGLNKRMSWGKICED